MVEGGEAREKGKEGSGEGYAPQRAA